MGACIRQISISPFMIKGERFPLMLEAIKNAADNNKWKGYGWRENVIKATNLSYVAKEFGIHLIYEGDDLFTIDIDGIYCSSFLADMVRAVAPFMNDGIIRAEIENQKVALIFKDGKVSSVFDDDRLSEHEN